MSTESKEQLLVAIAISYKEHNRRTWVKKGASNSSIYEEGRKLYADEVPHNVPVFMQYFDTSFNNGMWIDLDSTYTAEHGNIIRIIDTFNTSRGCKRPASSGSDDEKEPDFDDFSTSFNNIGRSFRGRRTGKSQKRVPKRPDVRVELGWLNYYEPERQYKQVRSQSGGGVVPTLVNRDAGYQEVLQKAQQVFFPRRQSKMGKIIDFNVHLSNYRSQPFGEDEFPLSKLVEIGAKTRLYLCTRKIIHDNSDCSSESSDLADSVISENDLDEPPTSFNNIGHSIRGKMTEKFQSPVPKRPDVRVELGWLNYCEPERKYKQVRSQSGGGVVPTLMNRDAGYLEVLEKAQQVFFPERKSKMGKITEFTLHLSNYRSQPFGEDEFPLSKLVEIGMRTRLYLCTRKIIHDNSDCSSDRSDLGDSGISETDLDEPSTSFKNIGHSIHVKRIVKSQKPVPQRPDVRVELGWLNYCEPERQYKQVRSQSGGGVVPTLMNRDAGYQEVLEKAQQVFFPERKSKMGKISEFTLHLSNYRSQPFGEEEFPLSKLVEIGMRTKLYLCTRKIIQDNSDGSSDSSDLADAGISENDFDEPSKSFNNSISGKMTAKSQKLEPKEPDVCVDLGWLNYCEPERQYIKIIPDNSDNSSDRSDPSNSGMPE